MGRLRAPGTFKSGYRQVAGRRRFGRRLAASVLAPVLVGGSSLVPAVAVAVAGGAAVAAVSAAVTATPAKAAVTGPVLVLLQNGESTAPETTVLQNAGYTVSQVTPSTWEAMTTSQFQAYAALVIGDPSSGGSCSALTPTTGTSGSDALGTSWQAAVTGDVAVLGTAPVLPGTSGANTLISDAVGYAAARFSSGAGTGLYISLNCEYATAAAGTSAPLLNGVEGIGTAGGLTVQGSLSCADSGSVNAWETDAAGTFSGFTGAFLTSGSWPLPACPVQEAFDSWPAIFIPAAYDGATDAKANFTASDGMTGQPYILLGAPVTAATAALAPSSGGEVPAGATVGGANATAPGVVQAAAGDPVDTEDGDFSQADTDVSVPTFGPPLDFARTYDSDLAQQQTQAGTPGPLGYGWTDDWASSLVAGRPAPGDIYTLDGTSSDTGTGGPPTGAVLDRPDQVFVHAADAYIADTAGNRVEEVPGESGTQWGIAMTAGDLYTVAGSDTGTAGASGNGIAAGHTLLDQPSGLAVDSSGNLLISDTGNDRVVEIAATTGTQWGAISMTAGDLYVIAGRTGDGTIGLDGKPATQSDLNDPESIHLGAGSNEDLYIADTGNNRIQEIAGASGESEWGQSGMTLGDVYTVAGSAAGTEGSSGDGGTADSALLNAPNGVTIGGSGDMYIADTQNDRVQEVPKSSGEQWGITPAFTADDIYTVAGRTGDGTIGLDGKPATQSDLNVPDGVRCTNGGNLYIDDTGNERVQEVAVTSHTEFGQAMTADDVYTVAGSPAGSAGYSGNGGLGTSALLDNPEDIFLDGSGDIYIADTGNDRVREITAATGDISGFAGDGFSLWNDGNGGQATGGGLLNPDGVSTDSRGNVYIADTDNDRVQEIAASTHSQFGISMTAGDVYTVAGSATGGSGISGDGGLATAARLDTPVGVAVDAAGDLYIADTENNRIQKVSASTGDISTIAGSAAGTPGDGGDGGSATSATLSGPWAIAIDGIGDLFVADTGNNRIQEVPAASGTQFGQHMTGGDMYTIAGSATGGSGIAGDGGPGTSALLSSPFGVAVDTAGDVYATDSSNNRVQEIPAASGTQWAQHMTGGDIYTVAGSATGASGTPGDGGPAASALLSGPAGIAVDSSGDLYIADGINNRIQEVAAANGTQRSTSMTAGDIYTVAGSATGATGTALGDGGPATAALLFAPLGVGVDPAGNIYIIDESNDRLREVTATAAGDLPAYPSPGGIVISQPDGSQVTFYPQSGGSCTAPYRPAGGYCALPQDTGATLSYSSSSQTYTYSPAPGTTYTYAWDGALTTETDSAGGTLTISYLTPAPGSGNCPAAASSCQTITSASGRALVIGSSSAGLVTSVTDPKGREWTYGYTGADLASAIDPMGDKTSYGYGEGSTGNPLLANDLLTVTGPNAQAGGPDAGDATVNVYNSAGQVTSQTDPRGLKTTFSYCVNADAADCMNTATGNGYVTVADPDGDSTVYDYDQGTLAAQSAFTGTALTAEQDYVPDTTAGGTSGGTLLATASFDGDQYPSATSYDSRGNAVAVTSPDGVGSQTATSTAQFTTMDRPSCTGTAQAATPCSATEAGPSPVPQGGVITPPSAAPPAGETWTLYDTDGNELYASTGIYEPGATSAAYARTTYQLFKGNSVTLNSTSISCAAQPPAASLPCATINADGVVTQLGYNAQGDLASSATPDGNGSQVAMTTYGYDSDGEQTSSVTPDGNVSGGNAGNYTTVTAFNADGGQTSVTEAGGTGATVTPRVTSYGYDADGNQTTVRDARGYTTTTTYNADDQATLVTNPAGDATLTCYDGDGNAAQTVPAAGIAAGSLTPASCPASYPSGYATRLASDATSYTFDADGDQSAVTTPAPAGQAAAQTTTYTYDADDNVLTTTEPAASAGGQALVVADTYNSSGQLASSTIGYGSSVPSTTSYCYDPDGSQTSVVAPDGNTSAVAPCETSSPWAVSASADPTQAAHQTTSSYDSAGELVSATSPVTAAAPSGATTSYTYDPAGNKLTAKDPDGVTTTWTYAPGNLTASVSYSGSSAHSASYTYDADGSMTGMTDATGSPSYAYDPFGELTSETSGAGRTAGYGYDADGDTTGITYPLPATATWAATDTVSYGYNNADQLTSVTDFNGHQLAITPDADGLTASETLGSTGDTVTTSYDNADTPSAISLKNSSSTLQSFSYSDAPAGTILAETDTPASSRSPADYTYDARGRVTSLTPGTGSALDYGFDASANLTKLPTGAAGTYDGASELTSSVLAGTTTNYAYNADGERLTAKQGSATTASGTWNGAGELTGYSNAAANLSAASYDGNGLRATATSTPAGGSAATQNFVWDTSQPGSALLMDSGNAYIYALPRTPAEQVSLSSGTITYLVADALGSVRGTVNSAGTLTGTASYDAWGNPAVSGGLTGSTPFGFAGGYTDPDGLLYLINRYYDPATGQFMSVDPEVSQTNQPYQYASGNPVSLVDPDGLDDSTLGTHCASVTSVTSTSSGGFRKGDRRGQMCVSMIDRTSPAGAEGLRAKVGFTARSRGLDSAFATHVWLEVCIYEGGCRPEWQQYSLGNTNLRDVLHYQVQESGWYMVNTELPGIEIWSIRARAYGVTMGWYHSSQLACYGGCSSDKFDSQKQTLTSGWTRS